MAQTRAEIFCSSRANAIEALKDKGKTVTLFRAPFGDNLLP
jgi:hypothetical protein